MRGHSRATPVLVSEPVVEVNSLCTYLITFSINALTYAHLPAPPYAPNVQRTPHPCRTPRRHAYVGGGVRKDIRNVGNQFSLNWQPL